MFYLCHCKCQSGQPSKTISDRYFYDTLRKAKGMVAQVTFTQFIISGKVAFLLSALAKTNF